MTKVKKTAITFTLILLIIVAIIMPTYATEKGKATEDLKLRKEENTESIILEIIPKNDEFEILEKGEEWCRVNYQKIKGYVKTESVEFQISEESKSKETSNNTKENTNQEEGTKEEDKPTTGEKARIKEESSLVIRPLISSLKIETLQKDQEVAIMQILNQWAYVQTDSKTGWVRYEQLTKKQEVKNDVKENTKTKEEEQVSTINKTGYVTSDGINFREEANTDSKVLKTFLQNAQVTILKEQGEWYQVKYKEQIGYILKSYVSTKKTEVTSRSSEQRSVDTPVQQKETKIESNVSKGQEVVNFAKKYLGSKYVYGGASPKGFDCSGYTMYVYKQFGVNLSHSATAQSKVGTQVEKSELQLGDLVFFSDYRTYKGIGHCGIYVGNNQFIHASTDKVGVVTSSLSTQGYIKRYVTARRVI